MTLVFKPILDEQPSGAIDELMQEFYSDLANKVSIDQEFVSLNAFELFTRQRGLSRVLKELLTDVAMRSKA